jgi:hypothetical protein
MARASLNSGHDGKLHSTGMQEVSKPLNRKGGVGKFRFETDSITISAPTV